MTIGILEKNTLKTPNILASKEKRKLLYRCILLLFVLLVICYIGFNWSNNKLTYIECFSTKASSYDIIQIEEKGLEIKQEFIMPYDILDRLAFYVGTNYRASNSNWVIRILDSNDTIYYEGNFNANTAADNSFFSYRLPKRVHLKRGEKYSLSITSKDVTPTSSLAFYISTQKEDERLSLFYSGNLKEGTLIYRIYGGDSDPFWYYTPLLYIMVFVFVILRYWYDQKHNISIREDYLIQGVSLGLIFFIIMSTYAKGGGFTDEFDNLRGGVLISEGSVLYRDYVTQHMPVAYYLCGVFAKLGASSIEQFRLCFYLFEAIIWCFAYNRYAKPFGKKTILALIIGDGVLLPQIVPYYGGMVLYDSIQGIFHVILLLEYFYYLKDYELKWSRCIVISLCIWGSFGSAFTSAFSLVFVFLLFIINEKKNHKLLCISINRYYRLIISIVVPMSIYISFLLLSQSLKPAFEQAYLFNVQVYPKYAGEASLLDPIFGGFAHTANEFINNVVSIFSNNFSVNILIKLIVTLLCILSICSMISKGYKMEALAVIAFIITPSYRGYSFHALAVWRVMILTIAVRYSFLKILSQRKRVSLALICILLTCPFLVSLNSNIKARDIEVSDDEAAIASVIKNDDESSFFYDAQSLDSMFFQYKSIKPVNSAIYMLPWYMEWYENNDIEDLLSKQPKYVLFDENRSIWGFSHYTSNFESYLKQYYTQVGEDGWKRLLWKRKNDQK